MQRADTEFLSLVEELHEELLEELNYEEMKSVEHDAKEERSLLVKEVEKLLTRRKLKISEEERSAIRDAVIDEITGFGPVQPLLADSTVTDIFINSPEIVFVERRGRVERVPVRFVDDAHVYRLVQRVASKTGRHLDLGTPYLDAHLPDGSRLHAIIPPVALEGTKVSIRKFFFRKLGMEKLIEGGSLTEEMCKLLQIAVTSRLNLVICGGTGSGKTTMLNSLLGSIRGGERVITIEDTPELEPSHGHTLRLITRAANAEGRGAVTQEHLMINALRMRPDRVILGELRGKEAFNLLHAMNTGQDGSMATLHASGTQEVIARLLNMILMAQYGLSVESVKQQIAGALDLVVYVARLVDGSRRVMSISQISCSEEGNVIADDLFRYRIESINEESLEGHFEQLSPPPSQRIIDKLTTSGLIGEYFDLFPSLLRPR